MFNSKFFFVIVFLTSIVLGAAVYLQVQEMMKYDLLEKLKTEYLSGILGDGSSEPAEEADESKKEDESKKDSADTAKKDDKK